METHLRMNTGMLGEGLPGRLQMPEHIWLEMRESDACDVIVQMADGAVYTALFATIDYLKDQMDLQYSLSAQLSTGTRVRYTALDTPHILVSELNRSVIETTIDHLIMQDVFEGHFTRVTRNEAVADDEHTTKDLAEVVITDVLTCI